MKIADKTVLVTGDHRGIGPALVEEALRRRSSREHAVPVPAEALAAQRRE